MSSSFTPDDVPDLKGKVALVTANCRTTIEISYLLARKNATVYIAAKDTEKTKRAIQDVKSRLRKDKGVKCTESEINARVLHHTLDFSEISSVIESAKDFIRHCERLDILIINTAVKCDGSAVGKLTPDGYESSFEELYLGPFAFLTEALPLVERTSKDYGDARIVVMVPNEYRESKTIDFEDLEEEWKQFCGFVRDGYNLKLKDRFYERSKLAALLSSKAMDEKLRERGILNVFTNICYSKTSHPIGRSNYIRNPLGCLRRLFDVTSSESALTPVHLATSPIIRSEDLHGKLYQPRINYLEYRSIVWKERDYKTDEDLAEKLWEYSEAAVRNGLTSLRPPTRPPSPNGEHRKSTATVTIVTDTREEETQEPKLEECRQLEQRDHCDCSST